MEEGSSYDAWLSRVSAPRQAPPAGAGRHGARDDLGVRGVQRQREGRCEGAAACRARSSDAPGQAMWRGCCGATGGGCCPAPTTPTCASARIWTTSSCTWCVASLPARLAPATQQLPLELPCAEGGMWVPGTLAARAHAGSPKLSRRCDPWALTGGLARAPPTTRTTCRTSRRRCSRRRLWRSARRSWWRSGTTCAARHAPGRLIPSPGHSAAPGGPLGPFRSSSEHQGSAQTPTLGSSAPPGAPLTRWAAPGGGAAGHLHGLLHVRLHD